MPIDPSISMGVRQLEVPDPLNQLAKVSQIQASQQQLQLGKLQIEDLLNDRKEMLALQQETGASTPQLITSLLRNPKTRAQGIELQMKYQQQQQADSFLRQRYPGMPSLFGAPAAAAPGAAAAPAGELAAPSEPTGVQVGGPIAPRAAMPAANALPAAVGAVPPAAPAAANALVAPSGRSRRELEYTIEAAKMNPYLAGAAEVAKLELAELMKPQVVAPGGTLLMGGKPVFTAPERQDTDLIREYNLAKKEGFAGSIFDYKRMIAQAGRPVTPPPPSAPVAVVEPGTGNTIYVSREEALRGRMTPAGQGTTLAPKEIQKREASYPQATSAIKGFETKSESFIKDLEALRDHPGLSQITGIVAGRVPGVTAEGRAAQALYDKIVAKGGFQALQDMRDASKTGGALGNVSNQEGKQLVASFAAIDRRQDAPDVQAAIDQAINDIRGSQTRMREAYDETYSYRTQGGAARLSRQLAPEDKQALDWANSNPKDPRAAQIKARLGVQ